MREQVLLEAEERAELLDQARILLQIKAAGLDSGNMSAVQDYKKLAETVDRLAFPENYKKSEFADDEFQDKIAKLQKGTKALSTIKNIKNGPRTRIPRKAGRS